MRIGMQNYYNNINGELASKGEYIPRLILLILLMGVVALNIAAADKRSTEFKSLSELSEALPHITMPIDSALLKTFGSWYDEAYFELRCKRDDLKRNKNFAKADSINLILNNYFYDDTRIFLSEEFVAKYLYQVQNLVRYCYDVKVLENSYAACQVVDLKDRSYLIYSSSGPFNLSYYLADITDGGGDTRYPVTLEFFRWWAALTLIWPTCPNGIDTVTLHIQQKCESCESDEGQDVLVEDTHTFKLSSGIESIGKGTEAFVYTIPEREIPFGLNPDILQISLSNWTIPRDTAQWHVDIKDIPDLCQRLPRDTASIYTAVRQIIDGTYDTRNSVELSEDFVMKYLCQMQNMEAFRFCTDPLLNIEMGYTAHKTINVGNREYLLYEIDAPIGNTLYLADVTDIQGKRYPITLALFRSTDDETVIWPTYDDATGVLTIHNQSECYNCDYVDDFDEWKTIHEQSQGYRLDNGIESLGMDSMEYFYAVKIKYFPTGPVPVIKRHSIKYQVLYNNHDDYDPILMMLEDLE